MAKWQRVSTARQLSAYLREELVRGRWRGVMPGVIRLANELGLARDSVEAAMHELELEGVLRSQGRGRGRLIDLTAIGQKTPGLRVAILLGDSDDRRVDYMVELIHLLEEAGHAPFFSRKTLEDLGADVKRLARFVRRTEADAWVVMAGSLDVLKWFSTQQIPIFALFGRFGNLPIPGIGPDKSPAYAEVVRLLVVHGHQRIVLLARPQRRNPQPTQPPPPEWTFLRTLEAEGIVVSDYNFPDWDNTKEGFHRCLESLFQLTSPTALIVQESQLFAAVQQFLAARGIKVPQDISLVCADPDPTFAWQIPSVTHIRSDSTPWIRRIIRWAANVSRGKEDHRQGLSKAEFVVGGTIGPTRR
jgi:DNA-binding LacI/PurR family transcriptional regulator